MEKNKLHIAYLVSALFLLWICVFGLSIIDICEAQEGVYVQDYKADLYLDGTLDESFVYKIDAADKYRMLYRNWKMPLSLDSLNQPFIRVLSVSGPLGCIPYVKGGTGEVWQLSGLGNLITQADIENLAYNNEAGVYRPGRFPAGIYKANYTFQIHPLLEVDEKHSHWNLRLADEHLPYRHFTIAVHDPSNLVERLFPYPSTQVRREADAWIMEGFSPKDGLLEVEMLLKANATSKIEGFPASVADVEGKTLAAASEKSMRKTEKTSDSLQVDDIVFMAIIFLLFTIFMFALFWILEKLGIGRGGSGGYDWGGGGGGGGHTGGSGHSRGGGGGGSG